MKTFQAENQAEDAGLAPWGRLLRDLRFAENPSFTGEQIAYLEDLLANSLLNIVLQAKTAHDCASCTSTVERILRGIRGLRG